MADVVDNIRAGRSEPQADTVGQTPPGVRERLSLLLPYGLLLIGLVLPHFMFSKDTRSSDIGLGPAAWPNIMLYGIALFSALWIARDIWAARSDARIPSLNIPHDEEAYHQFKAFVGLLMIIAYGWLLPIAGFAVSTSAFIFLWCIVSGLRNLKVVLPVTVLGTIGLMWLFMGLALMPLPRGQGVFDGFSIWLLRAVGIY